MKSFLHLSDLKERYTCITYPPYLSKISLVCDRTQKNPFANRLTTATKNISLKTLKTIVTAHFVQVTGTYPMLTYKIRVTLNSTLLWLIAPLNTPTPAI